MKNKLIYSCVFVILTSHFCSFSMFSRFSRAFRFASNRLRSKAVGKFLGSMSYCDLSDLKSVENFTETIESPIRASQEVVYSEQEYLSISQGLDFNKGTLRRSHCPFFASLCNKSNDASDEIILEAIDTLNKNESEIVNAMGYDRVYDYLYDCELRVPFEPLYHAVRMNKGLAVIEKLVQECGCNVNFNVFQHALGYEVERLKEIVLCPTPLFWAFLHGNYEVAEYLISQGARTNIENVLGKFPADMAKKLKDSSYRRIKKKIEV